MSNKNYQQGRRPRFLKPGGDNIYGPSISAPCMQDKAGDPQIEATMVVNNPYGSLSIQQQRSRLPIFKNRNHILYLLENYQTVVIVGETGCGKSTQVPQYLVDVGWADQGRKICITQPRRVAAVTLANRVAEEYQCALGRDVGYCVRFDDFTCDTTKIKYVTDGILIREMMADPLLTEYSVVMVDEAHERSINTDIICALLRKIAIKRKDLRLIISSATLDAEHFRDYFDLNLNSTHADAPSTSSAISVEGRMHPVQIFFTNTPISDYVQTMIETVMNLHSRESPGDILCFLTGMDEVEQACGQLKEASSKLGRNVDKLWVLPMYGALPPRDQHKVFDSSPAGTRKVVLATNIAEASITIPGIAFVIDSGFVKLRVLNKITGLESLMTVPISKASAEQRAGRAGRIRPGKCYRLYPQSEFDKLRDDTVPEIQRCHLGAVILQLKALGIDNIHKFHYVSRPSSFAMIRGFDLLHALGAIGDDGLLTDDGLKMAELPLPPMHSKILLNSEEFECSEEIITILAMLQIQDVFLFPLGQKHQAQVQKRKFSVEEGDHFTLLNVYRAFEKSRKSQKWCSDHFVNYKGLCRASQIREQIERLARKYKVALLKCEGFIGADDKIARCLTSGLFANAAQLGHDNIYRTIREDYPFKVHQGSAIMYRKEYPKWIIFNEVMADSIRDITVIDPEWLYELAPHYYEFGTEGERSSKRRKLDTEDGDT